MSSAPARADAVPVALITGAGRRIGNAVARTLAGKGYRLALHARGSLAGAQETVDAVRAAGGQALAVAAELTRPDELRAMIDATLREFGRIDALVNCAAIWKSKPLEQVEPDDVSAHFQVNTLATFLCCQQVGLVMVGQESGGAIVNIGDWSIVRPYLNYAAYFPSKGTIPTLTRTFAVELGTRNPRVRVNAILPGPVIFPPDLPADERQAAIDGTLVKREGSPENVAHAVVFLLENDFVTGIALPVDGGRSVYAKG